MDVDLILDIGNSRTTGILVETLPQRVTNLNDSYLLELRDLSQPDRIYAEPFETRVEFVDAAFGNDALSGVRAARARPLPGLRPCVSGRRPRAWQPRPSALKAPPACQPQTLSLGRAPWQQSWRYNTSSRPSP